MKLLNNGKFVVGFDLSETYAQISYANIDDGNVETVSSIVGEEYYNIPAVLCKKEGTNQWFFGKEALRYFKEGDGTIGESEETGKHGILLDNLLSLAIGGEPVLIEGTSYQPEALLTLFVKKCFGMLTQIVPAVKISTLMVTCEKMDGRTLEVLGQVVNGLQLKSDKIFFQSHVESFYHYMIYQPEELWNRQVLLCEYSGSKIIVYRMEHNRRTTPIAVFVEERKYPFTAYEPMPMGEILQKEKLERLDGEFLELLENVCGEQIISSAYLIGEQFSEEWMKASLRYLCRGRRVFQGNNLYSKGAVYSLLERINPSEAGTNHVFLGSDKLKTNVGMKILRRGQASYYALLDAGVNWYEAEVNTEIYLQEGNQIEIMLTSLIGGKNKLATITLDGLPEGVCRLGMHLYLKDNRHLAVAIEDLGFGVFRPATHRVWEEVLELENG